MINSLYLHVPFCKTICGYCDFCHFLFNEDKVNKWLMGLEKEINDKGINKKLKTIYIGGGTPTSLNYNQLKKVLVLLKPYTNYIEEYTIEVNPETINEDKIKLLKEYGINRVSVGVQSSDDRLLKIMNRHHDFNSVIHCINLFRKHNITNISVDIMYGLPFQTINDLDVTLNDVLQLEVPHVSIYCLTIEEGTLFDKLNYQKVDEDLDADMYELINIKLIENGYKQYEISNYCKEGYESKHNLTYWNYEDFYGISLSASGKEDNVRYDNTTDLDKYLAGIYVENVISLTKEDSMFEYIMMGLRKREGIFIEDFNKRYNISFLENYKNELNSLKNDGLIVLTKNNIRCSNRGYEICNEVIERFMK